MFSKCILLLFCSVFIEAQIPYRPIAQRCHYPFLDHGRVRVRQRSKLVKFMCSHNYELVGNRYATCHDGEWDVPMPVCVKSGCPNLPTPQFSVQNKVHHNAWVVTYCWPGYKLIGSQAMYCNGFKWNASNPVCVPSNTEESLSCDFEDPNICGWTQDELHDFDWKRLNHKTPSSFMRTGPSYDHTLGKDNSGYYMYIESTSRNENDSARLISPIYEQHLSTDGCFSFFYHMFGQTVGGLRIYQKPDSVPLNDILNKNQYILFEQWGNLGDFWFSAAPALKDFRENFQVASFTWNEAVDIITCARRERLGFYLSLIGTDEVTWIVIEGVRGKSFTSDIAIDDVAIMQGINCSNFNIAATSPATFYSETCAGRCQSTDAVGSSDCRCSINCMRDGNCCSDFIELCFFGNFNGSSSDSDDPASTDTQTEESEDTTTTPYERPTTTTTERLTTTTTQRTTPKPTTSTQSTTTTSTTVKTTTRTMPTQTIKTTIPTTKTTKKVIALSTTTPKTTVTTTKRPITTKSTTRKVVTTFPTTTKRSVISTSTTTSATTISTTKKYQMKQKIEKELSVQKMIGNKPVEKKSSTFKTAIIIIVVLSVFASLIYLGVASRTARGRVALARLRGRITSTHDPEVHYLNSNNDDDL